MQGMLMVALAEGKAVTDFKAWDVKKLGWEDMDAGATGSAPAYPRVDPAVAAEGEHFFVFGTSLRALHHRLSWCPLLYSRIQPV